MMRLITRVSTTCVLIACAIAAANARSGGIPAPAPAASAPQRAAAAAVTSPEKFFGFQMGADRKMARWDKLVEYYRLLEKEGGGKLKAIDMGPTEMGNPFLLVIITSAANQQNLEQLRQNNLKLSDPRGIPEPEIRKIADASKPFVLMTMSMHATEIGGAQMAPELAYDLLARTDTDTQRILDNVVFLLFPSFNPDGEIMVTDFYNKYLGTQYRGGRAAVALQQVHRPRQQPRRDDDEHQGVAVRGEGALH